MRVPMKLTGMSRSWGRQALRVWRSLRWLVIAGLWCFTATLGYVGFTQIAAAGRSHSSPWDHLYLTLQLFTLSSGAVMGPKPLALEIARFLAPLVAAYTAVQALALLFVEQFQAIQLHFVRHHVVICGLGRRGLLLAHAFRERGERVVVIERDASNDSIRRCRAEGIIVLVGDATDAEMLRRAGVSRAKYLIAVCAREGDNAEIAAQARAAVVGRSGTPLTCLVHIVLPDLCALLRNLAFDAANHRGFRLEFFNTFDIGARMMLELHPFDAPGAAGNSAPHLLIVGFGSLGQNLAVRAAWLWRHRPGPQGERLTITVLDRDAQPKTDLLNLRYRKLAQACQLIPYPMDTHSPEFQQAEFLRDAAGRPSVTAIYICFDGDAQALAAALTLWQHVRGRDVSIVMRTASAGGLTTLLCANEDGAGVHPFPLLERSCRPEQVIGGAHEVMARALHALYQQEQAEKGETAATNPSMRPWDDLPAELQESNRAQADAIGLTLQTAGYGLAPLTDWEAETFEFPQSDLDRMAEQEHARFLAERLSAGWKLGAKDTARKTNPDLVPWAQLSAQARAKTERPLRELPRVLAEAGLEIYRLEGKSCEGRPAGIEKSEGVR